MKKRYTRVCAEINLDAIEHNVDRIAERVKKGTKIVGVVKADGYGHGAAQTATLLSEKDYIWGFATATFEEALALRRAGVKKPVLVFGSIFPEQREEMLKEEIRMTCYTAEMAVETSKLAQRLGKKAYLHIKLDTGMSRLGFLINEESMKTIAEIAKLPELVMEGLFTHFIKADEADKSFTKKQLEDFLFAKEALKKRGVVFPYYHCSNSAGIIDVREADMELVRAGIATYGLYPSEEVDKKNLPLRPALSLVSCATHVKWVEAGTPVGYGGTYVTDKRTRIVTVPVGYGDGYPRSLSNKGFVLLHARRAPIIGRICMDQLMVDATEIENAAIGDKITLIGKEGEEEITVDELSRLSGRFPYEFVCCLGKRVPREYQRQGEITAQTDYFF